MKTLGVVSLTAAIAVCLLVSVVPTAESATSGSEAHPTKVEGCLKTFQQIGQCIQDCNKQQASCLAPCAPPPQGDQCIGACTTQAGYCVTACYKGCNDGGT